MKKSLHFNIKIVSFFILSLVFSLSYGQIRDISDAASIANEFSKSLLLDNAVSGTKTAVQATKLIYTRSDLSSKTPYFYVFSRGENEGFIIISGEERAEEILGYSDNGSFDINKLPDNFKAWLNTYEAELKVLSTLSDEEFKANAVKEPEFKSANYATEVAALLGDIQWNQGDPYNLHCPEYNGYLSVTGCVATAVAQIMRYHKWPVSGTGSHSYTTTTLGLELGVNFAETTYDWDNMTPQYGVNSTQIEKDAVAELMYHCGVAAEMDYTPSLSGAYSHDIATGLINYFSYDDNIQIKYRDYYNYYEWMDIIKVELNNNRPIYHDGYSKGGGHAFVCDGYNEDNYFHYNWGWGGSYDGYFLLSALNPGTGGIGAGSADGYNRYQKIIVGIQKPNESSVRNYEMCLEYEPYTGVDSIERTASFSIRTSISNVGVNTFVGEVGFALYDTNNVFKNIIYSKDITLLYMKYYEDLNVESVVIPDSVANGTYLLYPIYKANDMPNWEIMRGWLGFPNCLRVTISSELIIFNRETKLEPDLELLNLSVVGNLYSYESGQINLKIKNTGVEYNSNITILLSDSEDETTKICDILLLLLTGDSIELNLQEMIPVSAGDYKLLVCSAYDNIADICFGKVGEIPVIVQPLLLLNDTISFVDNKYVPKKNAELRASITNNAAGRFLGKVETYIYPSEAFSFPEGQVPLTTDFGHQYISIDSGETKDIVLKGDIDLPSEKYMIKIKYHKENQLHDFTPYEESRILFDLVNPTSNELASKSKLSIYPNPAIDILTVEATYEVELYRIYNLQGVLQSEFASNGLKTEISLENLSAGVYILQAVKESGEIINTRFVKK